MKTIKVKRYLDILKNFTGIVEYPNKRKQWFLNGIRHREDGPAVEDFDGTKQWLLNGVYHRIGGPAIEYSNGEKMVFEWTIAQRKWPCC